MIDLREAINIKQQKIKGLYRLNLIELIIIIHNLYASPGDAHSLFKISGEQDSNIIFIESKNNLRSRQEGNSGLIKLAASSNDDNVYKIDFGYEGEKHFRVKFSTKIMKVIY